MASSLIQCPALDYGVWCQAITGLSIEEAERIFSQDQQIVLFNLWATKKDPLLACLQRYYQAGDSASSFAEALRNLSPWLNEDPDARGALLWGSLANVEWRKFSLSRESPNCLVGLTFRSASRLVYLLVKGIEQAVGNPLFYMEFVNSSPYGTIDPHVRKTFASFGWEPEEVTP